MIHFDKKLLLTAILSSTVTALCFSGGAKLLASAEDNKTQLEIVSPLLNEKGSIAVDADKEKSGDEVTANFEKMDTAIKSNAAAIDHTDGAVKVNSSDIEKLLDSLTIDGELIKLGKDENGKIGYVVSEGGADSVRPFSGDVAVSYIVNTTGHVSGTYTATEDCILVISLHTGIYGDDRGSYVTCNPSSGCTVLNTNGGNCSNGKKMDCGSWAYWFGTVKVPKGQSVTYKTSSGDVRKNAENSRNMIVKIKM